MLGMWQRSLRIARLGMLARKIHKAQSPEAQATAKQELAKQMADARGVPMKIGQIMAGMSDDNEFNALTASVKPWSNQDIVPILEKAWKRPLAEVVEVLEESTAAASLGQVHKATLVNGRVVAIKVQYPGIASAIDAELKLANLLPGMGPVKRWGFDLPGYKLVLKRNMQQELDYCAEAKQQTVYAKMMSVPGLQVPMIVADLCRDNVLVQSWVEGVRLVEAASWPLPDRLQVGKTLMQTAFQSLFVHGLVHGDPHPGNLLYQVGDAGPEVHLLDFGCTVTVTKTQQLALLKLILTARGESEINVLDGFVALGFAADKLVNLGDDLEKILPLLFRPFLEARPFDSAEWQLGTELTALLNERRWWFRAAGPANLLLLMRVFQGLVQQLKLLECKLPFWPILTQCVPSALLDEAKAWIPPSSGHSHRLSSATASRLWIKIVSDGQEQQCLAFPATEALHLAEFIPDEIATLIRRSGVDIAKLQEQVLKRGLVPQPLVSIEDENTIYRVWLE